jgi:hypothetical protein
VKEEVREYPASCALGGEGQAVWAGFGAVCGRFLGGVWAVCGRLLRIEPFVRLGGYGRFGWFQAALVWVQRAAVETADAAWAAPHCPPSKSSAPAGTRAPPAHVYTRTVGVSPAQTRLLPSGDSAA